MNPKYIQVDCPETNEVSFAQAEAVTKYKPDIIILEYTNNNPTPDTPYNNYPSDNKPLDLIGKQKENLQKASKTDAWAASDIAMWNSIARLWQEGKNCLVYRCDAPHELTSEWHTSVWKNMWPCVLHNWVWWVQIYLREKYMATNVAWILCHYKEKENPTILVFLQSFHWRHTKFLLKNPTKEEEWDYYFGKRFPDITLQEVNGSIPKLNKVFYKYWNKVSRFKL
jgi:hypothetical protein